MGLVSSAPTNGHGGGFLAPPPPPSGATTTYGPRSVTSSVSGGAGGGGGVLEQMLQKLIAKKTADPVQPRRVPFGAHAAKGRGVIREGIGSSRAGAPRKSAAAEALDARKAADAYEMSRRSAARKPVSGFNYMGYDQGIERLPSSFRPEGAGFSGPTHSVPTGSIDPAQPDAPLTAQPQPLMMSGIDPRMVVLTQMLAAGGR
jgi:hypothetical protein